MPPDVEPDLRPTVTLRPMLRSDLADLVRWRRAEHVARWFDPGEPVTPASVEQHYGPRIDGTDPVRMSVVEANGRSVGFLQDYRVADQRGTAIPVADPEVVGLDYAIGEPGWLGRGVGSGMLRAWLAAARTDHPAATTYVAAPDHRNHVSRRLLVSHGFVEGVWFDEPRADGSAATLVAHSLLLG